MGNVHMEASQINYRGGETKMSVEEALKNTSGEAAAIAALQTAVGNLQSGKANLSVIAPAFSAETAYAVGDIVTYEGATYRCTTAHEGEWDATDFTATTISGELASLNGDVVDLNSTKANQITIAPYFSADTAYDPGDLVYYNGLTYRCTNAHEGAWDAQDFAATTIDGELSSLRSGLTNLTYHKIAESAGTGTTGSKLLSLASAYNALSMPDKMATLLVKNNTDLFMPTNINGVFHTVFVNSAYTVIMSIALTGSYFENCNGIVDDKSSTETNDVFSLWVAN